MKIPNSRAAHRRFELVEHRGYKQPEIPEQPGPVHVVMLEQPKSYRAYRLRRFREMHDVEFVHESYAKPVAACGVPVSIVYPMPFQTDDQDACSTCRSLVRILPIDPDEFWRQVEECEDREYQRYLERQRKRQAKTEAQQLIADVQAAYEPVTEVPDGVDVHDNSTWTFPELHRDDETESGDSDERTGS